MFRYLDVQMLKCLDTWILGCSEAHVDCSKHCALPYNQLLSHSCPLCYNSWRIRHILKKYDGYSTLCLCNVIFSIAQKFLCVGLAMCISIYIYDGCVFAVNQGVFAVHATFGPLHRGGSRQWNQEVLCLTQPPPPPQHTAEESGSAKNLPLTVQLHCCSAEKLATPRTSLPSPIVAAAAGLFCQSPS